MSTSLLELRRERIGYPGFIRCKLVPDWLGVDPPTWEWPDRSRPYDWERV